MELAIESPGGLDVGVGSTDETRDEVSKKLCLLIHRINFLCNQGWYILDNKDYQEAEFEY